MDLEQGVIEFLTHARGGVLSFVTLRLQTGDGFSSSLAILGQLLRRTLELCQLGAIEFRSGRTRGLIELDELHRIRRRARWYQGRGEGHLVASLELRQARAQRFERAVALLQFQLLLVEQLSGQRRTLDPHDKD